MRWTQGKIVGTANAQTNTNMKWHIDRHHPSIPIPPHKALRMLKKLNKDMKSLLVDALAKRTWHPIDEISIIIIELKLGIPHIFSADFCWVDGPLFEESTFCQCFDQQLTGTDMLYRWSSTRLMIASSDNAAARRISRIRHRQTPVATT